MSFMPKPNGVYWREKIKELGYDKNRTAPATKLENWERKMRSYDNSASRLQQHIKRYEITGCVNFEGVVEAFQKSFSDLVFEERELLHEEAVHQQYLVYIRSAKRKMKNGIPLSKQEKYALKVQSGKAKYRM